MLNLFKGRNPWPIAIVAFFLVFIAATAGLVIFSMLHKEDLVSADYYEQELRHQRQMERVGRTQALRVPVMIGYDARRQVITIALPVEHARQHATGRIRFYRPSAAQLDREVNLEVNAAGVQSVDARALRPGLWKVRVSWKVQDQEYFHDQSITVRKSAATS